MRILIVEDDDGIRDILAESLRTESFAVETARDGEEGLLRAERERYDLILLDYLLPKRDGAALCGALRSRHVETPVLVLSARHEISDKLKLFDVGADDYLTKPFSYKELVARIRAILRRPLQIEAALITCGDVSIDSEHQTVRCRRREVRLTRKEFALLEFLASRQGEVVTREMITDHVWAGRAEFFSNTIETHIFNLRRKLAAGRRTKILTVPGRGYRLYVSPS